MASLKVENLIFRGRGPYNFTVPANTCISLSGPSGSGKTQLLRAIADLDKHQGDCFIDQQRCKGMMAPQWRRMLGFLPAKSVWWYDTVGEHFSNIDTDWLSSVGFSSDVLQWSISRLSTGEQQRLSFIRLLQNRPSVLLLDEPTASLDRDNIHRVEQLTQEYKSAYQCAIIWVTHDREQADRVADRQFVMQDKQLQPLEETKE